MASSDKIATRYARAIFEFIGEKDKIRKTADELQVFAQLISENKELELVLARDLFSSDKRRNIIEDLCQQTQVTGETKRVLLYLSEADRLGVVSGVAGKLKYLILTSANIVPLKVEAGTALNDEERKKVEDKFKKVLGTDVEATYEVVPQLLGGLKVTAAGRTYDGTLATRLSTIKEQMVGGQ